MKKLSDILEEAAAGYESGVYTGYSCLTVYNLIPFTDEYHSQLKQFNEGIQNMGLKYTDGNTFRGVPYSERQQARMMWLTWAAMMAREQGL